MISIYLLLDCLFYQSNVQILFYVVSNSFLQSLHIHNLHVLCMAQIEHHEWVEVVGESLQHPRIAAVLSDVARYFWIILLESSHSLQFQAESDVNLLLARHVERVDAQLLVLLLELPRFVGHHYLFGARDAEYLHLVLFCLIAVNILVVVDVERFYDTILDCAAVYRLVSHKPVPLRRYAFKGVQW